MAYNTRRSGNFVPANQPPPVSAVGLRRPAPVSNNFVSGGQLNLHSQGNYQQNYQRQQQNFQGQQQRQPPIKQQQFQQQKPQIQQQQQLLPPQEQKFTVPENRIDNAVSNQQTPPGNQNLQAPPENNAQENPEETDKKPKWAWLKNTGKISRKEKIRRRNKRLVKFLQPKNAVMVLNEMIGNSTYTLSENPDPFTDGYQFKASVLVDGMEHYGYGKGKMAAKASAAETAIKYLVLKKLRASGQTANSVVSQIDSGEDVKIEEASEEPTLPWQHVASFALHKLFSAWDEGGDITERLVTNVTTTADGTPVVPEKKPAKKMPPNPETMNPIMLLNQMVPHAQYVELSKAGNPPSIVFTYKCSANGQSFIGRGSNKKRAKKMCAFEACRTLLNVEYPPEVFAPHAPAGQTEPMQT